MQTKKKKIRMQGSKIQIITIFARMSFLKRQEALCIFYPFNFFGEKRTSHFNPFKWMDLVITGRKLSTFACLAIERYRV